MIIGAPTMRQQFAAQAVIEELLRQHGSTPPRTAFAKFFGYSRLSEESVSWYLGVTGEIAVGRILATLPPEWTSFHALPIGKKGSDIDHIVIGPGGVFTIKTKHHAGKPVWVGERTVMVSGQKQPYIRNSEYEAGRVTKLLRERMPLLPAAQPVLALVNPKTLTIKTTPEQVKVIADTGLRRWLLKRPAVLEVAELGQLAAIIDDPATWPAVLFPPPADSLLRFAVLDAEVRTARTRRRVWSFLGSLTLCAAVFGGWQLLPAILGAILTGSPR
jgi:hypothetical protein